MPVDWTLQRAVLPISGADPGAPSTRTAVPPRRAIALKLSEHVLAQLQTVLAQHKPATLEQAAALKGLVQIDLSETPSLIVNGATFPLILAAEPKHSELARIAASATASTASATPPLEPFATVSHKASVKPGGNLAKVGQTLRETREQAEKQREGRKAVLIETAPNRSSSQHKRKLSDSRDQSPAPSRNASPAPPRHASRLTVVPNKMPHGHSRLAQTAKASSSSVASGKSDVTDAIQSNTDVNDEKIATAKDKPTAQAQSAPLEAKGTSQGSSPAESASSSTSSAMSVNQSTSTGRTSLSTLGSPAAAVADLPTGAETAESGDMEKSEPGSKASQDPSKDVSEQSRAPSDDSATKPRPRSGSWASYVLDKGGDVIKSAGNMLRSSTKRSSDAATAPASIPEEETSESVAKKRRVSVAPDLQDGTTPGISSKLSGLPSTKIPKLHPTKQVKKDSNGKTSSGSRRKERVKAERWYSSSSDEDAEGEEDVDPQQSDSVHAPPKQSRTSPASTTARPNLSSSISVVPTFANATVDDFTTLSQRFTTLFKTYETLHNLLTTEQQALKAGSAGEFDLTMTDSLVKKLIGMRLELGRIQERLTTLKKQSAAAST
ncbi:hypothetical protein OIV83_002240 [Microbotryomycetes sp. JL201]|nr:hypothetical protein OIV83_002240 [Microbotryomycetes sp. JL201]